MAEPEEVLIDTARRAVALAGRWRRRVDAPGDSYLAEHRRRLEMLLTAVFDLELPLRVAQPPAPPSLLRRMFGRPRRLVCPFAIPSTDGRHILLPRRMATSGPLPPARWFRALALQQAGRAWRGSAQWASLPAQGLAHELYLLSEAAAVDAHLACGLPGVADDLALMRAAALSARPQMRLLTPGEQATEALYRAVLEGPLASPDVLPCAASPADSWQWAESTAGRIEAEHGRLFRGLRRDLWLGELRRPGVVAGMHAGSSNDESPPGPPRTGKLWRRPEIRAPREDEDDAEPGPWMLQMDDPHEHVEDPMGLQRPIDRDAGKHPDEAADSLSELPEARLVATPERAREIFVSHDPPDTGAAREANERFIGLPYPEWDCRTSAYRPHGTTVQVLPPSVGDPFWAQGVIARRKPIFDEVRRRFEGLRPRRVAHRRQLDGDEIDLDACVEAQADRLSGRVPEERLYVTNRPARRDLALLVLVDISASTDAWVSDNLRVVDVEKEALLLCCHAVDALGDPYAVQAFSGEGPHGVRVWPVKDFEETAPGLVHRRIAALEPQSHTRAGAALRHAAAQLSRRREAHQLLLLLSDGRPNDVDQYAGPYGAEDMRQAVNEAAAAGLHCFCLTVDREAPEYVGRIFGPGRHATLAHPGHLSTALLEVLRRIVRR